EYLALLLVLETGVNGVFVSLDYLLFFLFWQMQAVPMFLLIARYGGPRRLAAAWKFLAVDLAGSGLLLLAILILYFKAPLRTFDIVALHDLVLPTAMATLVAWLFFIAFAVKLPVFPFHTWFIDAQAEASAPVALILGGVLVKLGGYGLIRVDVGEFQTALHNFAGAVVVIAVVTVLWSAIAALAQDDLRRIVGYVVMSHMGLVLLAAATAAPVALNGAIVLMVADGLTVGLLVLLVAAIVERTGTSSVRAMGGMAGRMGKGAVLWISAALAAIGFPGLAGFVGQLLIVVGAYPSHRIATPLALVGVLAVAFLALTPQFKQTITILDGAFLLDGFAIVIDVVVLAAAALTLMASRADILPGDGQAEAVPGSLLLATLGAMLTASAAEMVSLFLALELLAINLYVLS